MVKLKMSKKVFIHASMIWKAYLKLCSVMTSGWKTSSLEQISRVQCFYDYMEHYSETAALSSLPCMDTAVLQKVYFLA